MAPHVLYPELSKVAAYSRADTDASHLHDEAGRALRAIEAADRLAAWVAELDLETDDAGYGPERDVLLDAYAYARGTLWTR